MSLAKFFTDFCIPCFSQFGLGLSASRQVLKEMLTSWLRTLGNVFKQFHFIFDFFIEHIKVCLIIFDPIYNAPPEVSIRNLSSFKQYREDRAAHAERAYHRYFILPILICAILSGDTLWVLYKNRFEYETNPMPEMFTHRMYEPLFYQQGDMLVLNGIWGILIMNFTLLTRKWLNDRYCMYFVYERDKQASLIADGKIWNQENSNRIYRIHYLSMKFVKMLAATSQIVGYGYFLWNFLHTPFNDLKYWGEIILFLPILTWYFVLDTILMFWYFFISAKYVLIKQSYLLGLMENLVSSLKKSNSPSKAKYTSFYSQFRAINQHQAYQCAEIAGYNDFWSKILTVQFSMETILFCYLLYCCRFFEQTIVQFIYYVFFLVQFSVLIFAVNYRCSQVDTNNDRAYACNVKAAVLFQLNFENINHRQMLNVDKIATNRNFSRACFGLSNNYRLDSTAFQLATYMISTFFLMICRKNKRQLVYGA